MSMYGPFTTNANYWRWYYEVNEVAVSGTKHTLRYKLYLAHYGDSGNYLTGGSLTFSVSTGDGNNYATKTITPPYTTIAISKDYSAKTLITELDLDYDTSTHSFDAQEIKIGAEFTYSASPSNGVKLQSGEQKFSISATATRAGGATVNSITDNGDNTLTIVTTMGDNGVNNNVSNVHIYGLVNDTTNTPGVSTYNFVYGEGVISDRTVTFTIPAPTTSSTYMVRVCAYSISALGDNPGGTAKNSDTCYYNQLILNYYSNYATEAYSGTLNQVSADKNVIVGKTTIKPNNKFEYIIPEYTDADSTMFLGRKGYKSIRNWGTEPFGEILIPEDTKFSSYSDLLNALSISGKGYLVGNLFPQWRRDIKIKINDAWIDCITKYKSNSEWLDIEINKI